METKYSRIINKEEIEKYINTTDFISMFCNDIKSKCKSVLDPFKDHTFTYDIDESTIIGLYTKLYKYSTIALEAYGSKNYDLITLLSRPSYEVLVLIKYLILRGKESQRHYRLVSYRRRFKNYELQKEYEGIGDVLRNKTEYALSVDGFTFEDLERENKKTKGRKWALDGKTFQQIHNEVEIQETYSHVYGPMSETIHSGWGDIRQLHLTHCEGDFFVPNIEFYNKTDLRLLNPILAFMLEGGESILKWNKRSEELPMICELTRVNNLMTEYILEIYITDPDNYLYN